MGNLCSQRPQQLELNISSPDDLYAICILEETEGSKVNGLIKIQQLSENTCRIQAKIKGLAKGLHGFHIHQYGNLSEGCKTAGPHFNPLNKTHGGPGIEIRHVGDLGNINSEGPEKEAIYDEKCEQVQIVGEHSIIGRSFVVHADQDDLGKGGNEESKKTGNAGKRLACGVIARSQEIKFQ